jgi:hypothetical protein
MIALGERLDKGEITWKAYQQGAESIEAEHDLKKLMNKGGLISQNAIDAAEAGAQGCGTGLPWTVMQTLRLRFEVNVNKANAFFAEYSNDMLETGDGKAIDPYKGDRVK